MTSITLSAPVNLRDLGGIAVDGGSLRTGLVIRTDDLSLVTASVAGELYEKGLRSIIDLRSVEEAQVTGRGPLGELPVAYHHVPLMGSIGEAMDGDTPALTHETMGRMYVGLVENAASQLVTALNVIAYSPGTTAFHCAAGRDRTGVLAAVLLLALGADDQEIVADYALTGPNMPAIQERTQSVIGPIMLKLGFDLEQLNRGSELEKDGMEHSMQMLIATLRETYGDPLTPLRVAGLSPDTVAQLRRRALDPAA
ncbi:tyrosine-protein phosphatase [Leucobacter chinensis]|uniref:tyrosine-protein phosphatase n=1 Tax=Leucobacter chinensis TaxID=2851010 RepID=UPI001C24199A|nr:tyrosine-protein phosphatase [Leucobacter chinensis]